MTIMNERRLSLALAAAMLCMLGAAGPAAAQGTVRSGTDTSVNAVENQVRLAAVEPRTQGDVSYVSGGIGTDSVQAMRQIQSGYNLQLLFAVQGSGEYLADVHVKLVDQKGNTVLDAVSDGPYFYAKLRPGRYQIVAANGPTTMSRSVDLGEHAMTQSFYWRAAN